MVGIIASGRALCDNMSLLLLPSVRSMHEMVGLRAGGKGGSEGGGVGARHGLLLLCVVGSCSGALGAWCQLQLAHGVSRHILGVAVMVEAAVVHVVEVGVLEPAGSSWHVLVDG